MGDGQRIYEFNPEDGTIWHVIPAPSASVDGLASADGRLYALSFAENRIYRLDPFDGQVGDKPNRQRVV